MNRGTWHLILKNMWPLLLIVCVAAASAGQNAPAATNARKLEAAREFVRARNACDYAINTPNGIDEAKWHTSRRIC
jgi:hypothetical protein